MYTLCGCRQTLVERLKRRASKPLQRWLAQKHVFHVSGRLWTGFGSLMCMYLRVREALERLICIYSKCLEGVCGFWWAPVFNQALNLGGSAREGPRACGGRGGDEWGRRSGSELI